MFIFGLKCIFCANQLETLGIENGVISTKCTHCGHISKPKAITLSNDTIYSKFANKNVQVQYNAKKPRSGEFRRVSVLNSNEVYPDRKKFTK